MSLCTVNGFGIMDGTLYFKSDTGDLPVTIDILTNIVQRADFEDMDPNTTMLNGVRILKLDFALGAKINCFYLRAEDDNDQKKKQSDVEDIPFIIQKMIELGQRISNICAVRFRIGYYHMIVCRNTFTC
jgi:hypothetical protein